MPQSLIKSSQRFLPLALISLLLPTTACRSLSGGSDRSGNYGGLGDNENNGNGGTKDDGTLKSTIFQLDPASRGLGDGYDTQKKVKLAPCIDPSAYTYRGANSSDLSFMRDYSYDQIMNEVGAGIYAKASLFGLASAKVQGDMATSLATTDSTSSFIYNFRIVGKSAVIDGRKFNINGSSAYHTSDALHFREVCGDTFVEQVKLGAQLFVGVKFTFASKETKEKISLTLQGSLLWGLIKFSKTWTKEFRELMEKVRISVDAFQIGGDPTQLEALKKETSDVSCAGDNADRCAEAVDKILEYGRTGFSSQLANMEMSKSDTSGPAIIDVTTEAYGSQKIFDSKTNKYVQVNVPSITSAQDQLAAVDAQLDRIEVDLKVALARVITLQDFNLSDDEKNKVRDSRNSIESVLKAVSSLREGTCTSALKDDRFIASCASQAGLIENDANKAVNPLSLNPI